MDCAMKDDRKEKCQHGVRDEFKYLRGRARHVMQGGMVDICGCETGPQFGLEPSLVLGSGVAGKSMN